MKKYTINIIKKNKNVFLILLLSDLFIIGLHLLFGKNQTFFNLDHERNLPTAYQSAKLIFLAFYFLINIKEQKFPKKIIGFILPISIFFLVLGFDELLEIHENIYRIFEFLAFFRPETVVDASQKLGYHSSLWIIYYLPAILIYFFWSGYWFHYFQAKFKSVALIIAISSILLPIILITEILSSSGLYSSDLYFKLITIEEIAEILFATILIGGVLEILNSKNKK